MRLSLQIASSLAELPLRGIAREYPHKLAHTVNGPADLKPPRTLHPAFYGCFDWHSSVHGHWMLAYLLKRFPLADGDRIRSLMRGNLSAENLRAEADYFSEPNRQDFERPYGWAWLLKLSQELRDWDDDDGRAWAQAVRPLEDLLVARISEFLPRQSYPVRTGTHSNTAFSLALIRDYAGASGNGKLLALIDERARTYFALDRAYQTAQEPSGADFLSPCLIEADLLRRVMPAPEFRTWFAAYLPELGVGRAESVLTPVEVSDRTDPQIGHLDGLNMSRSWCLAGIASSLEDGPLGRMLVDAGQHHAVKGLSHVSSGDYAGEHWLATFAVYMLATLEGAQPSRVE